MNKHEFRIGNKVLLGSEVCTLFEDEFKTPEHGFGDYSHPQLKGIPLTEEWLLKFGFAKVKSSYEEAETFDFELRPLYYCSSDSYWECFNCRIELEYVHELQNLYHAITGKELVGKI